VGARTCTSRGRNYHQTYIPSVLRLLTPLKISYQAARKQAEPYTKIVEELPQMRQETVQFVPQAVSEGREWRVTQSRLAPMCW
jgi:hypothetical protein